MNRMEAGLLRAITFVGASLWFARLVFSSKARRDANLVMQVVDDLQRR